MLYWQQQEALPVIWRMNTCCPNKEKLIECAKFYSTQQFFLQIILENIKIHFSIIIQVVSLKHKF